MHHFVINLIKITAHQMQDFQLDKHHVWRPGSARTRWGSLTAPPDPLAAKGGLLLRGGDGRERGKGGERRGKKGRGGKGGVEGRERGKGGREEDGRGRKGGRKGALLISGQRGLFP